MRLIATLLIVATLTSCVQASIKSRAVVPPASDDVLLDDVEHRS
ncbi:MAG: hypothetical protein QOC82_3757, partial [Frankiaceae bacterium]|nr:hypothetical protein [Frankiaceae bacterium]